MKDRSEITTEQRNARTRDIDQRSTLQIVDAINAEDRKVASAVGKERRQIAAAADMLVQSFLRGGRLIYVGAGTSGRLGVLDAAECPPTFSTSPSMVQGIIAGGRRALIRAVEGAEDSASDGARALSKRGLTPRDVVVGIAACGMTPFVRGAIEYANEIGTNSIFITCAPESKSEITADIIIAPVVGPEVITGSTRMKAGTATKLILNTLTTTAMVKLGKAYGNLMVDVKARSEKLCDRAERIVMEAADVSRSRARRLLVQARGSAKVAILMHCKAISCDEALKRLKQLKGSLRRALSQEVRETRT